MKPEGARLGALVAVVLVSPAAAETFGSIEELGRLSIEQLSQVEVTSVSKRPESLSEAAASIFVITADDIRRSAATSLPEVLRLAPNLEVMRIDALNYVITARGFGPPIASANKLLVLIDGRNVYSPLFSGVFWDSQQLPLTEIQRIEVISGPGGTLWGANAVNGVINIITRDAADTQGIAARLDATTIDQSLSLRYGGRLGPRTAYRIYGLAFRRGHTISAAGIDANDEWQALKGGFRIDWEGTRDALMLRGDIYNGTVERGENNREQTIQARWTRTFSSTSSLEVLGYIDRAPRAARGAHDLMTVYYGEFTHRFAWGPRQKIVWGGALGHVRDNFSADPGATFELSPPSHSRTGTNFFIQDSIALSRNVTFTIGSKFIYGSFNRFQYMPSVRLAWHPDKSSLFWGAISRAVRTPSRIDKGLMALPTLAGGPDFRSETLTAYELGYRAQPARDTSLSLTLFYHDHDRLRTVETTGGGLPVVIANGIAGHSYGAEAWSSLQLNGWWRIKAGATWLEKRFHIRSGHEDLTSFQVTGNDPKYQLSFGSQMDLPHRLEVDVQLRHVARLPSPEVPAYTEADFRLGWNASDRFSVALVGNNLLHDKHAEGNNGASANQIRRSIGLRAQWRF